ncbi:MAG: hypothetical protein JXA69_14600 [Phycisphaerae bacterium]|nr:hypothetical protein [Phycisphaerae bacterium]
MKRKLVLAFASVLAIGAVAHADVIGTLNATAALSSMRQEVRIWGDGRQNTHTYAGMTRFTGHSATGAGLELDNSFSAFCVDLEQGISSPYTHTWDVRDPSEAPIGPGGSTTYVMGTEKAGRLGLLFGQHFSGVTTAQSAAAFQLAVWEIVYESDTIALSDYDVTAGYTGSGANGGFQATGNAATLALANSWLQGLDASGTQANLLGLTSIYTQDFATIRNIPDPVPIIPAPSAALLAVIGLGLVGWIRRRIV